MVEIVWGSTHLVFGTIIWIVFILEFALRLSLAPDKTAFFRLLALCGFAVFGYITASFATFFIGQEAKAKESDVAGSGDIAGLRDEIARLRATLLSRPSAQEAR